MTGGRLGIALGLLAALAWGGWGCPPAAAYVPPAAHLLERMHQALGHAEAATVWQRVAILTGGETPGETVLTETLRFWPPRRLRSDIEGQGVRHLRVVSGERCLTAIDGRIVPDVESRYDAYKNLFLQESAGALEAQLTSLGVNLRVTSPGRLDGLPVFVVGAQYPDLTLPQLWLDRETLRPVRQILPPGARARGAGVLDVRYARWRRVDTFWYPGEVSFHLDGRPVRRIRLEGAGVAAGFEAALFDIGGLTSSLEAAPEMAPRPPSPATEVRAAIEDFRRLYE